MSDRLPCLIVVLLEGGSLTATTTSIDELLSNLLCLVIRLLLLRSLSDALCLATLHVRIVLLSHGWLSLENQRGEWDLLALLVLEVDSDWLAGLFLEEAFSERLSVRTGKSASQIKIELKGILVVGDLVA